jgi:hypothetical protein
MNPLTNDPLSMELDELQSPYRFDMQATNFINNKSLLEQIERVGTVIY